ncbi:MAG: AHH domain-containing protein [Cellulophaga sp.]
MKNKISAKFVYFLFLFFFIFSCEEEKLPQELIEEAKQEISSTYNGKIQYLKATDISGVIKRINYHINNPKFKINIEQKILEEELLIDNENVLVITDTLGYTNYTFNVFLDDGQENTLYNMVTGVDKEGNQDRPYLVKYECDLDHIDAFIESNYNVKFFDGTISRYYLNNLQSDSKGNTLFSKSSCPPDDYKVASGENNTSGSNSGGGNGNSGNGNSTQSGTGSGGVPVYCNTRVVVTYCSGPNHCSPGASECGPKDAYVTVTTSCSDGSVRRTQLQKSEDCPKDKGDIGVIFDKYKVSKISSVLKLTKKEEDFLKGETQLTDNIFTYLSKNTGSLQAKSAALVTIRTVKSNLLYSPYNNRYMNEVYCCSPNLITNPTLGLNYYNYVKTQVAIIKSQYPSNYQFTNWELTKIYMEANLDAFQFGLDLIGIIPAFGEIADITNGVIYTVRGDGVNASLSYSSAIPLAGWFTTGTKLGLKVIKLADNAKTTLKWIVDSNGIIKFGNSSQLRKVMGNLVKAGEHAHHIIPFAKSNHSLVQKAAKSKKAFHINEALNGIPVASWRNSNHPAYSNQVVDLMDDIITQSPNLTPNQAFEKLVELKTYVEGVIKNNPNVKIQNLSL